MRREKSTIIVFLVVSLISTGLFGIMSGNDSEGAYDESRTEKISSRSTTPPMRVLVIEGAGYYLKSQSDALDFFNAIELSELTNGPDYKELSVFLDSAVSNMKKSRDMYYRLKATSLVTPYNPVVTDKLRALSYDDLQDRYNLNSTIFKEVKGFLSRNDVNGVYNRFYLNTSRILELLYDMQKLVDAGIFPGRNLLWELNQSYSSSLLFGQYVAIVFSSIK
jgi:hypothetical protein